jgi:hypothetical protein
MALALALARLWDILYFNGVWVTGWLGYWLAWVILCWGGFIYEVVFDVMIA